MANKKYRIRLTTHQQHELKTLVSRGWTAAYKQTHAQTHARIRLKSLHPSLEI